MNRASLRLVDYLRHIVEAAERIQKHTENLDSHGYFSVNLGIVWRTTKRNIPALGHQIRSMLEAMDTESDHA